jgi:uncharacterized membrane protein YphA (DoxX/SURF4 family)
MPTAQASNLVGAGGYPLSSTVRISGLAAFMLVVLRLSIGWHFLYEGMWKYEHPSFSAEGFFKQARGPWAKWYHDLIPDYEGRERLDLDKMASQWKDYRHQFDAFYKLDDDQTKASEEIYARRHKQLEAYLKEIDQDSKEYFQNLDKLQKAQASDPTADSVPYSQKRYHDGIAALRAKAAPWLAEVDRLERDFRNELDSLLDKDQQSRGRPSIGLTKLDKIDRLTTYGLMAIGVGLLAGLFTRFFCLAGGVFLASILLSQPAWPTIYPPLPPSAGHSLVVNKEFIEMIAMLALATTPVGRWAGLDFFIHNLLIRPFFSAKGK